MIYLYHRSNNRHPEPGEDGVARTPHQQRETTEVPTGHTRPWGCYEAADTGPDVVISEDQPTIAVPCKSVDSVEMDEAFAKYRPADLELRRQAGDARVALVETRAKQPMDKPKKTEQRPSAAAQGAGNVIKSPGAPVHKLAAESKPFSAKIPKSTDAARKVTNVNAVPKPKTPLTPVGRSINVTRKNIDRAPQTAKPSKTKVKSPTAPRGSVKTSVGKQRTAASAKVAGVEAVHKKAAAPKQAQSQKVQAKAHAVHKKLPKPAKADTDRKAPCATVAIVQKTPKEPSYAARVATAAAAMADSLKVSVPDYWIQGSDRSSSASSRGSVRSASSVPSHGSGVGSQGSDSSSTSSDDSSDSAIYDPLWMFRTDNLPQPPADDSLNDKRMRATLLATASLIVLVTIVFVVVAIASRLLRRHWYGSLSLDE